VVACGALAVEQLDEDIRVHCAPDGEVDFDFAPALNVAWRVGSLDLQYLAERLDGEAGPFEVKGEIFAQVRIDQSDPH
jgi:hypothetical protein